MESDRKNSRFAVSLVRQDPRHLDNSRHLSIYIDVNLEISYFDTAWRYLPGQSNN